MNILFLVGGWSVGGVERVTRVLADGFAARGCGVGIVAHRIEDRKLLEGCDPCISVHELPKKERVAALRKILLDGKIDVVINQWALPATITLTIRRAARGLGVRVVEVQHNAPDNNNRMLKARSGLERLLWKSLAIVNMRIVYRLCDRYVFLTPGVEESFFRFTGIADRRKAVVIPNPIVTSDAGATPRSKENLIIYVGRLSEPEKRPSRVLDVWRELVDKLPDWNLEIVGDGPDRAALERVASNLPRVKFMGFQNATPYYQRAKLLLLTSEYEGFGMVLIEAMSQGCVPLAYGSCPAVCDLIEDGKDGMLTERPFDGRKMVSQIVACADDELRLVQMSKAAIEKSKCFTLDSVIEKWSDLVRVICE